MQNIVIAGGELIADLPAYAAEVAKGIVYGAGGELVMEAVHELKEGERKVQDAIIHEVHELLTRLEHEGEELIETVESKIDEMRRGRRRKRPRTRAPTDEALVKMVDDVKESRQIAMTVVAPKGGGSFVKMPKRKYNGKSKSKRRTKKRKLVTKRGVKQMIARNAVFAGSWLWYIFSESQFIGSYSTGAVSEYGVKARGSIVLLGGLSNVAGLKTAVYDKALNIPATGAADQPQADTYTYYFRKALHRFYFHSCMTENQSATVWILRQKQNNDNVPTTTWSTAWGDFAVTAGGTYASMAFADDFSTYPTEFREFRRNFEIVKKYHFGLTPGQTKMIKCKGLFRKVFNPEDDNSAGYTYGKDTYWLMYELQGVPTHNGTTPTLTQVDWSPTGIDLIWDIKYQFGASANNAKAQYRYNSRTALTAAGKSLIPEVTTNITAV